MIIDHDYNYVVCMLHLPRGLLLIHVMHWINELLYYYAKVGIIEITPHKICVILFTVIIKVPHKIITMD